MDLFIRNLDDEEELLTDYEVARKESVNGDKQISVTITKTDKNEHAYGMVINENIFYYGNEPYVIKNHKERIVGKTVKIECQAIHKMFDDLKNNYIYEQISGTVRIRELIDFASRGTEYFFSVDDSDLPLSVLVENFGDDNSLSLFKSVLDRFGAEFMVIESYVIVAKQIGSVTDEQIRYKFNVNDPQKEIDTSSFSTYIRGYGKQDEDGSYLAYQEYTSPLAEFYGIKHAKPVRDNRFIDNSSLLDRIKRELNDSIDISLTLTYVELHNMGISNAQFVNKGDFIWCILDPFDIDVQIRVLEKEDYSDPLRSPQLTIGTISRKATDVMASFNATKKTVNKVIDNESNTVRKNALSIETNYVVDAVERTFGHIDYTDDISASDPVNFMKKVGLRKGGIYRMTDGYNRLFVITPDGVDIEQSFGKLKEEQARIGPETTFAEGYDPTQIVIPDVPEYELATETKAGLMSAPDKIKLNKIELDNEGNLIVTFPLSTITEDGLMGKEDKQKLNQIVISEVGQVIDLSILMDKISDLEIDNTDLQTKIENIQQRLTDLEGGNV